MNLLKRLTFRPFLRQLSMFIIAGVVVGSGFSTISIIAFGNAQSVKDLRQQSERLQADIESSDQQAEELNRRSITLQETVNAYDAQIEVTSRQIQQINGEISTLEEELTKAEAELERQKELLRINMRALYRRGGASTIELLAASDSFTDFIDEQENLERLKNGIQDSTNQVIKLQEQMEEQKAEQEDLLEQEEAVRRTLDEARADRQQLLAQTRGEEARFRQQIEALQEKRKEVEEELRRRIIAGNMANLGEVQAGQMIGRVGMTGMTTGPHLHFEYRNTSFQPIDPGWQGGSTLSHGLRWPLPEPYNFTQNYGCGAPYDWYTNKCSDGTSLHAGIDVATNRQTGIPILAAKSGTMIHRSDDGDGYGIKAIIQHYDGTYSLYAHLSP